MICVPIASIGWAAGAFVFMILAIITHKPKDRWWKFGIDDLWFNAYLICAMQACFTFWA